ncbi:hypothetical protein OG601_47315 [Streptomyces sp. NBC_01239]|uniref:hypothetical protein n=1 Tax=Streptomyces sp. NBC_01239 TaxID=2903792 RepID=UPI002255D3E6|nr:hypothetical protein [Streptomyces sp. NBC_01239]MCX4816737.1 hypothetical protein [Streptomyces sp. NBC_01239]MCX4818185.1 hypothetical protein [Streptomyces sp. NBC_01239]
MHDHTPDDDGYEWPTCVTPNCKRQLWVAEADRWACRPCEDSTGKRIIEIPALYAQLDTTAMLMKGASRIGGGTSGSRTAPIPPRLDVLNLVGPGGIAARLRDIEDAWRAALGWNIAPWRGNPAEAIPRHVGFLANNLLWACERYESVGQDIDDLRRLHAECAALAAGEKRPGRVQIGACPVRLDDGWCGTALTASTGSHRVHCGGCKARWEGLGEWRELRAAQEAVTAEQARQAVEQEEMAA